MIFVPESFVNKEALWQEGGGNRKSFLCSRDTSFLTQQKHSIAKADDDSECCRSGNNTQSMTC